VKMCPRALCSASLVIAAGAAVAAAQTEIYFSEYQFQNPQIKAMGTDGSSPRLLFAPAPAQWLPLGLTVNPATGRVLWVDSAGSSEIMSANVDGSDAAVLATPPGFCRGISLDAAGRIYFSSNNSVMRVDADGGNLTTIFTSSGSAPVGNVRVDATNGHVYVGAEGGIKRMDLDGGNVKTVVQGIQTPRAIGLDVGAGYIYWIDANTHSDYVGRARLDGSDFTVLIDHTPFVVQTSGLIDLLVDPAGGFIYYADELTGVVYRAGLDGENPTGIYTSAGGPAPSGLTLSTGEPAQPMLDCNGNGIPDDEDIANGAPDCDNNGIIDTCQEGGCPQRTFLVDQGSDAADMFGRALGIPSQWQVFQPFDVPPGETWTIGEIGIDGYTSNYADGSGITIRLFPDDGTLARPDESQELAVPAVAHLRFSTDYENWVYAPLRATLPAGRYWVRLEANNPTAYGGSINHGFGGPASLSRGSSGNFTNPAPPIALRLVQGEACPADWDGDQQVNSNDISAFLTSWLDSVQNGALDADFDQSGSVNSNDISAFLTAWLAAVGGGC